MKKLNLGSFKEVLTREQMKKIAGGYKPHPCFGTCDEVNDNCDDDCTCVPGPQGPGEPANYLCDS
jgi:hypothetical protein